MIIGVLTFKPKQGGVSIIIEGDPKDILELSRLYGKKVTIAEYREEQAVVQSPTAVMTANLMHKFDGLIADMKELHDAVTGCEKTPLTEYQATRGDIIIGATGEAPQSKGAEEPAPEVNVYREGEGHAPLGSCGHEIDDANPEEVRSDLCHVCLAAAKDLVG